MNSDQPDSFEFDRARELIRQVEAPQPFSAGSLLRLFFLVAIVLLLMGYALRIAEPEDRATIWGVIALIAVPSAGALTALWKSRKRRKRLERELDRLIEAGRDGPRPNWLKTPESNAPPPGTVD